MPNRTQALVLGFFLAAWLALVATLLVRPQDLGTALHLPPNGPATGLVLVGVSALIALLSVGVLRRWRWIFWLILLAFLAGVLRVPASGLQLAGVLPGDAPSWYLLLQAVLGVVQFVIGIMMIAGYQQGGIWGEY
jgi:hypothetical protein